LGDAQTFADKVELWGTGQPWRELLYVDDLARAIVLLAGADRLGHLTYNVGADEDQTVADIAELVQAAVGFEGEIVWDTERPDGTFRRLIDSGRMRALGWKPLMTLRYGLERTVRWYRDRPDDRRDR